MAVNDFEFDRNIQEDTKLNRFALEKEADSHPEKVWYWHSEYAQAKLERQKAGNKVDALKAKTALNYRKNPPDEFPKPNNEVIKSLVDADESVVEAEEKLSKAYYKENLLNGAVKAVENCKGMIDNLRHLAISGYYSQSGFVAGNAENFANNDAAEEVRGNLNNRSKEA